MEIEVHIPSSSYSFFYPLHFLKNVFHKSPLAVSIGPKQVKKVDNHYQMQKTKLYENTSALSILHPRITNYHRPSLQRFMGQLINS